MEKQVESIFEISIISLILSLFISIFTSLFDQMIMHDI